MRGQGVSALRFAAGLVPPWGWAVLVTVALAAGGAWCHRAGAAAVQARWDRAELDRERQANADRLRNANRALDASATHETERAALARNLREARNAISTTLRASVSCPSSGRLADVVLPAAALAGVRDASGAERAP